MDRNKLRSNLDICKEALEYAGKLLQEGNDGDAVSLLKDVEKLTDTVTGFLAEDRASGKLIQNAMLSGKNMGYSLHQFLRFPQKRRRIFQCEIMPSFQRILYATNMQYDVYENPKALQEYRRGTIERMKGLHGKENRRKDYKYKVSIVLFAYNKLEYTKLAVESILKYTDFSRGDVELVTINNGSSDGTEEYFETLPHEKKVNFKHNILGLPTLLCEGEYRVSFSNDAVATPNWLEQLLVCIDSSDDIAMVVPTCNEEGISAKQGIPVPYRNDFSGMEEMEVFAEAYNHSNPRLWEDRIRLMPFVALWRNDVFDYRIMDPSYTKAEFVDDDFSTVLRRTGWRMVLAKDTFLHHFGSVTLGKERMKTFNNSFLEMRKVYFDKWGVDAWESRGVLDVEAIFKWILPRRDNRILWIEPKFGMDFLTVKNFYRQKGSKNVEADALVLDSRYLPDAKYYFNHCIFSENLLRTLSELKGKYDLIGMSSYLHEIVDGSAIVLLEKLYGLLNFGGHLVAPMKNWCSAVTLKEIVKSGSVYPWGCPANTFKGLSMWGVLGELSHHKFLKDYLLVPYLEDDQELCNAMHACLLNLFSSRYSSEDFKLVMEVSMMWLGFVKKSMDEGRVE